VEVDYVEDVAEVRNEIGMQTSEMETIRMIKASQGQFMMAGKREVQEVASVEEEDLEAEEALGVEVNKEVKVVDLSQEEGEEEVGESVISAEEVAVQ